VPGESAREDDVILVIARSTTGAELRITFHDYSAEMSLDPALPRSCPEVAIR